jgi:transposase-like protein
MNEKKLKAPAAELAKGLKTEADLNAFSRMLTKLTVETAPNTELTEHLRLEYQQRLFIQNAAVRRWRTRTEHTT